MKIVARFLVKKVLHKQKKKKKHIKVNQYIRSESKINFNTLYYFFFSQTDKN